MLSQFQVVQPDYTLFFSLWIKKGDEVIVPAMTHTATAHAIEYTGARAVFCDIDYKTGNICTSSFKKKLHTKPKLLQWYIWQVLQQY